MFNTKLVEASRELSKKELFKVTDFNGTMKLDKETEEGNEVKIDVDYYAIVEVTNDSNEVYEVMVVVDKKTGFRYSTGSSAFRNSFMKIVEVMDGEPFAIIVFKKESKRSGKTYIACTLD